MLITMKIRSSRNSGPHERAFTLAEVLISAAVIGILFVTLFYGISFCFSATKFERENLRATQIMLQRMEGIRLFNWSQLQNTNYNPTLTQERYIPANGTNAASGVTYDVTVSVTPVALNPSPTYSGYMRKVTVTVKWVSGNNITRSRSASTFVAKDGIQNYIYASSSS